MKAVRIILVVLVISFIAIQFIPKHFPENKTENENDIIKTGIVSEDVQSILKASCYDCHSNQTQSPWYAKVAPSAWLLADHINQGREHLNFSEWASYSKRKKVGLLEDIQEEVESGAMPLKSYLLMHRNAKITGDKKKLIDSWTDQATEKIMQ